MASIGDQASSYYFFSDHTSFEKVTTVGMGHVFKDDMSKTVVINTDAGV